MSVFVNTPVSDASKPSALLAAYDSHLERHPGSRRHAAEIERDWLDAIGKRAEGGDSQVQAMSRQMLGLLESEQRQMSEFAQIYEAALKIAYPVCSTFRSISGAVTPSMHILNLFDLGVMRKLEDDALSDRPLQSMLQELKHSLSEGPEKHEQSYEVYSEAHIYNHLRLRGNGNLRLERIKDSSRPNPDFEAWLQLGSKTLHFFIEVKTLSIVDGGWREPDLRAQDQDVHRELDDQLAQGKKVGIAVRTIAPYRTLEPKTAGRMSDARRSDYDPYSIRRVIETLIKKSFSAFKFKQFERGPTFALVNVLRLPSGQGANGLQPVIHETPEDQTGTTGVYWTLAFGIQGSRVYRAAEFEGAETADGELGLWGLLSDPASALPVPGLIVFAHEPKQQYVCYGLYDAARVPVDGWGRAETELVCSLLCDRSNDRLNTRFKAD